MDLRKFRHLTLAALLAAAGWLGIQEDAHAADFAEVSFEQMVDASNFIVRATVNKVCGQKGRVRKNLDSGRGHHHRLLQRDGLRYHHCGQPRRVLWR